MYQKSSSERAKIIQLLVEGNSIRGTARILDISKDTVLSLLVQVGIACKKLQEEKMVNLKCKIIQVDEMHSFIHKKDRNRAPSKKSKISEMNHGNVWAWVAIDADTKLIPCWHVGDRDDESAHAFVNDLASRMANKIQLTSDGFASYYAAVGEAFTDIDFGQISKMYDRKTGRYLGERKKRVFGNPDREKISTTFIERQNLTMRMSIRRCARKTNAFSKKLANHKHALALHFMHYNFCRIHSSIRMTPAMAAGLSDHVWSLEEFAKLID